MRFACKLMALVMLFSTAVPTTAQEKGKTVDCVEEARPPRILVEQGKDLRNESFGARRIVRRGDISYVGYSQLVGDKWQILVRPFDHRAKLFGKPVNIAPGNDDHSGMGLVSDSKGYLHCVMGGHGPVSYVRTVKPDDISQWTEPQKISDEGTYAMLMIDRRDRMYVFYRHHRIHLAMLTCTAGAQWSRPKVIGTTTGGKFFYIMGVAMGHEKNQQSLHVAGHFYGSPNSYGKPWPKEAYGYRIKPWYVCSPDGGNTWQKADGSPLTLPITDKTIDILFDFPEPYDIPWSMDVTLDEGNQPHVFCTWRYRKPSPKPSLKHTWNSSDMGPTLSPVLWELTWQNNSWVRKEVTSPSIEAGSLFYYPAAIFANGACHVAARTVSGKLVHLWSSPSGQWHEELVDDMQPGYANWKLPDASGVLELMWRGKPTAKDAKAAIFYSFGLSGSAPCAPIEHK